MSFSASCKGALTKTWNKLSKLNETQQEYIVSLEKVKTKEELEELLPDAVYRAEEAMAKVKTYRQASKNWKMFEMFEMFETLQTFAKFSLQRTFHALISFNELFILLLCIHPEKITSQKSHSTSNGIFSRILTIR